MPSSLYATDGRTAAKSSPEVARDGKIFGRSVAFSRTLFAAGRTGVSLHTSSGELALLF